MKQSAESRFLLVENYTLTAPTWVRPGREFLEHFLFWNLSFIAIDPIWIGVKKEAACDLTVPLGGGTVVLDSGCEIHGVVMTYISTIACFVINT